MAEGGLLFLQPRGWPAEVLNRGEFGASWSPPSTPAPRTLWTAPPMAAAIVTPLRAEAFGALLASHPNAPMVAPLVDGILTGFDNFADVAEHSERFEPPRPATEFAPVISAWLAGGGPRRAGWAGPPWAGPPAPAFVRRPSGERRRSRRTAALATG